MEQKNDKLRLHLNVFDAIVILLVLAVGAFLLWNRLKPDAGSGQGARSDTIQYTVLLQRAQPGTGACVAQGDALEDAVKNYTIGTVVSAEVLPATKSIIDEDARAYVTADIPGYEDVRIVVESSASISDEKILVGSGYELRVGDSIYVRGPGYLGSGVVYAIERGA